MAAVLNSRGEKGAQCGELADFQRETQGDLTRPSTEAPPPRPSDPPTLPALRMRRAWTPTADICAELPFRLVRSLCDSTNRPAPARDPSEWCPHPTLLQGHPHFLSGELSTAPRPLREKTSTRPDRGPSSRAARGLPHGSTWATWATGRREALNCTAFDLQLNLKCPSALKWHQNKWHFLPGHAAQT